MSSRCPSCGGEAVTGGFVHIGGCNWPVMLTDPIHYREQGMTWDNANVVSRLDDIVALLHRILRALDAAENPPADATSGEPCPMCNGAQRVMVPVGEHFVTREMAIDGGDPSLEGASMGVEYEERGCPDCGGSGRKG